MQLLHTLLFIAAAILIILVMCGWPLFLFLHCIVDIGIRGDETVMPVGWLISIFSQAYSWPIIIALFKL